MLRMSYSTVFIPYFHVLDSLKLWILYCSMGSHPCTEKYSHYECFFSYFSNPFFLSSINFVCTLCTLCNSSSTFPQIFTSKFEHVLAWFYQSNFGCCICSVQRVIRCFGIFYSSFKWLFNLLLFLSTLPIFALGTFRLRDDCSSLEWSF